MSSDSDPSTPAAANEWTVRKVLEWTTGHLKKHGSDTPRLDAEILLAHARSCQRIQLYTAYDQPLPDTVRATMRDLVQRRAKAEPVAYLVGHREFFSLDFRVTRDVLIPRPDTETLVIEIIDGLKSLMAARGETSETAGPIRVLDLCTGSGCIAIAVAKHALTAKWNVQVVATDISPAALAIAQENAAKNGVGDRIEFLQGDLFGPLTARRFEIIASNPPYVPTAEIDKLDPEIAQHEPRLALDGGPTGFDVIDRLVAEAKDHAQQNALFLMELSPEQADRVCQRLSATSGYNEIAIRKDLAGRPRVARAHLQ